MDSKPAVPYSELNPDRHLFMDVLPTSDFWLLYSWQYSLVRVDRFCSVSSVAVA